MDEITIHFGPDPKQLLIDHILENYQNLDNKCIVTDNITDTQKCVECHKNSYTPYGKPKYNFDNFKYIYLIRYLATQLEQNNFLIRAFILSYISEKSKISAISLGGGPSPELLALINELQDRDKKYEISFINIDDEASWEPIYHELSKYFAKESANIILRSAFVSANINSYVCEDKYDIIFIPWLLSEIDNRNRHQVIKMAISCAKSNGFILITDRSEEALISNISQNLSGISGITIIKKGALHGLYCGASFPNDVANLFKVRFKSYADYWIIKKI